jgi:signal transduction histidine kinase/HPt (histidine-containing phosphotransfer) domain-containing protein/ActR/RegA family two-component response regulator
MRVKADNALQPPQRRWLLTVVGVLMLVLVAVGYVQWRQYKLLHTAAHFQNDGLGWSFSQLETEQLRLRNQLELYADDPKRYDADSVQLRYDIFVSRVGLVDHPRAMDMMRDQPAYLPAMAQVRSFIAMADRYLGENPVKPFDAAANTELMARLDELNAPLHDLSLGASHLLYQRATTRNDAVRQQSELSIALTVFQCVLLLALAVIVLRQLRALTERRIHLESLAESLSAARHDAEAASRAKSAFLANMSHEIRTPFHGMLGMMSLLQEGGLSPRQALHLATARESAQHLLQILNDILDFSQLESGRLQVVPQTIELPQLVAQVDALMRVQANAKGVVLEVGLTSDVPRWVRADPTRIKQILFNLLSNALKFTPAGTVSLSVRTAPPDRVEFVVADTGIGMAPETVERLFQRFMQGDGSPSRRTGGTGLGLEISRDLARLMGGDITVRSTLGAGSCFTASLPLPAVKPPAPALDAADSAPSESGPPLRVLVAEDHPVNRAYLEAVIDKLGHHAVFAVDGDGAVRAMEAQPDDAPFDVVLMDLHMPGMDGFSAARAIRAMEPPRGRVPIVALTADAFQASRDLAMDAGMDGYLTKPAHLPQLREALARFGHPSRGGYPMPPIPMSSYRGDAPTADSTLDLATIESLCESLSPAKYNELLSGFLATRETGIAELRHAANRSQRDELRQRAHGMKGAALSLGLRSVGALASELQQAAADESTAALLVSIDRLDAQFERSAAECRRRALLDASPTAFAAQAARSPA